MTSWTAWDLARQRMSELGEDAARRHRLEIEAGKGRRRAAKDSAGRWARASAWLGYRMIAIGCRLARPKSSPPRRTRL